MPSGTSSHWVPRAERPLPDLVLFTVRQRRMRGRSGGEPSESSSCCTSPIGPAYTQPSPLLAACWSCSCAASSCEMRPLARAVKIGRASCRERV